MVDGKKLKPAGPANYTSAQRSASGLTRPGDLYLPGDALPMPEVVEKNTDSVWALFSDVVPSEAETMPSADKDFKETVPLDLDAMEPTQWMGLPEMDERKDHER